LDYSRCSSISDCRFSGRSSYKLLADRLLFWIEKTMDEPDAGLWEFRNVTQVHTYTLLFHWAGSRAVAKLGRNVGDKELVGKAEKARKDRVG